jgi:uncharacterized membrane protein YecN with MAPEG domain
MTLHITSLYASVLGLMMIGLSLAVSIKRGKTGIAILHGDNMDLAITMRRYGNFIEVVPFGLLLLALMEAGGASSTLVHLSGALLLVSRILHPFGLIVTNPKHPLRIVGGVLAQISALIAIAFLVWTFAA